MAQVSYQIDTAHSSAQFSVRHMMITNVRGDFTKLSGTITLDPANASTAAIDATIDVNSIRTREEKRDEHLKSADFFDAATYPAITFVSKSLAGSGEEWKLTGELTLHGVTREITLDVEGPSPEGKDPWGNLRIGATATGKLNRKDYGLTWNAALETGGVLVGEEVKITLDIQAIRQA